MIFPVKLKYFTLQKLSIKMILRFKFLKKSFLLNKTKTTGIEVPGPFVTNIFKFYLTNLHPVKKICKNKILLSI